MKTALLTGALLAALALPAFCQSGRLSPQDQREFDKIYSKWQSDTRRNDRDDIAKDVRRMQNIMARNNIPQDVPFDQVASTGNGYPGNGYEGRRYERRLPPQDQQEFDQTYSKWVNDTRRNDRDDVNRDVRRMQDIMTRNNIPPDVPFDQIASTGYAGNPGYGNQNQNPYYGNDNGYENNAYPRGNGPTRLSPDDQREFDKIYSKWVHDTRRNDRDDIEKDARKMQDIMARYNIPSDVPYDQIASPDADGYRH
jgi:hypothetical protein